MTVADITTHLDPSHVAEAGPSGGGTAFERLAAGARRLARSKRFVVGLAIMVFFALLAIVGPFLVRNPNSFIGPSMAAPSSRFWLGTTESGQDVFAQVVTSARGSLEVGFAAGALATAVSVVIGIGGAFLGGYADEVSSLFTNVILVIPGLPLVVIVASYMHGGLAAIIFVIAFTSWAGYARVLRGQTLSVRNRDYVLASRVAGERAWRIVLVEILPNELAIIISNFIFMVVFAIITQATLAFIGVGDTSTWTWGNMLYVANNDEALTSGAWWWFVPPGLCIALVGTALSLVNFGLDEMLNPRLRVYRAPRGKR